MRLHHQHERMVVCKTHRHAILISRSNSKLNKTLMSSTLTKYNAQQHTTQGHQDQLVLGQEPHPCWLRRFNRRSVPLTFAFQKLLLALCHAVRCICFRVIIKLYNTNETDTKIGQLALSTKL